MLLSKSSEYGIRATLYLSLLKTDGYVSIRDISDELGISFHFLTKIFQKLTQAGILHSFRGPNGGIAFARPASQVSLYDIVVSIDGPELFTECALGMHGCGTDKECPLHETWAAERERVKEMFSVAMLEETSQRISQQDLRLRESLPFLHA